MEIIPDQSTDLYGPTSTEDIAEITKPVAAMELQIGQAVLRISNQTDPRLLEQTLKLIGAFSCKAISLLWMIFILSVDILI